MKIYFYSCSYQNQNFSLVSHSCHPFSTRVALMSLVSHSRYTLVTSIALVLHLCCSCRTRVARVWHSCCKLDSIVTCIYRYVCWEMNAFFFNVFLNHFRKIHRSVFRKIAIDLLHFWDVYDVNLWEKNFGRSMAYSCKTNVFI